MSDAIITVENLGKKYQIDHQAERARYKMVREVITQKALGALRSLTSRRDPTSRRTTHEDFWALRDVSFEVEQGEVLGIIGRNGAGKSTLLKILSRITEPTQGRVTIRGRIASLLEVGTGFHQELTGRENVFLNGAILGMGKTEIDRKFDEIVDFAGVEKFLDTPVKRYSSGMYVRLAFAVAAHLEPEILIVDEVLAVGDQDFQNKCMGKMRDVSRGHGRTVLFVSHNMHAIQSLCRRGLLLEAGQVKAIGEIDDVVQLYRQGANLGCDVNFPVDPGRPSITSVSIDEERLADSTLAIDVGFKSPFPLRPPVVGIVISSLVGTPVFGSNPRFHSEGFDQAPSTEGVLRLTVDKLPIYGGTYQLSVWLGDWESNYDEKHDVLAFEFGMGHPPNNTPAPDQIGFVDFPARWSLAPRVVAEPR